MSAKRAALLGGAGLVLAGLLAVAYGVTAPSTGASVAIDSDDIGGVALNPSGKPEAGVWVIAHQYPGPGFEGIGPNSAESSYYSWVDQHNIFGLGNDVPMSTGNLNDGIIAYAGGKMVMLRVPYPLGWYGKGFDGRIDDPKAGWKGRGLWMANGDRTPWLIEGSKGSKPLAAHFQLRPDPLAK